MKNIDKSFSDEFKKMMNDRLCMRKGFKLDYLPLPELPTLMTSFSKDSVYLINGVKEPYFNKLNKTLVTLANDEDLYKRLVLPDGSFMTGSNGEEIKESVKVKQGFVAIQSDRPLGIRQRVKENGEVKLIVKENGVDREYYLTEGFKYVDYKDVTTEIALGLNNVKKEVIRKYTYIVPKENVYEANLGALVITSHYTNNSIYNGYKIALQNGYYIYLCVMDYKAAKGKENYRIIGTKQSLNFEVEIKKVLEYWICGNYMFPPVLTQLEYNEKGVTNVGMERINTLKLKDMGDYTFLGESLAN